MKNKRKKNLLKTFQLKQELYAPQSHNRTTDSATFWNCLKRLITHIQYPTIYIWTWIYYRPGWTNPTYLLIVASFFQLSLTVLPSYSHANDQTININVSIEMAINGLFSLILITLSKYFHCIFFYCLFRLLSTISFNATTIYGLFKQKIRIWMNLRYYRRRFFLCFV